MSNAWQVFVLFAVPIGGGIPAGVLLAKARGISWSVMTLIYFVSDVALACVFEPLMLLFIAGSRKSSALSRMGVAFQASVRRTTAVYGDRLGPLALVAISFGVDPMTGRAAARAAGYGFVRGWGVAIAGDLLFFGMLAVSTLLLNSVLGDGTAATLIILVVMTAVPVLVRKYRERAKAAKVETGA